MIEILKEDIELYDNLLKRLEVLDSSDYVTAYELAQRSLSLADRWNEIALNSKEYSKDTGYTKSEVAYYCQQKYKILIKAHDMCRCIWRQGEENMRYNNF